MIKIESFYHHPDAREYNKKYCIRKAGRKTSSSARRSAPCVRNTAIKIGNIKKT
jgi:hypothetical protein